MELYHVSANNLDGRVIKPSVPDNILTKTGSENATIGRISFSDSVDTAILAIGRNKLREGPKVLFVHEPQDYNRIKVVGPETLVRKGYVPDADQTREHWVLNSVRVRMIYRIKLIRETNKCIEIRFGKEKNDYIKNCFWDFKKLRTPIMDKILSLRLVQKFAQKN